MADRIAESHSTQRLSRPDGATIAYRRLAGKNPGIVFLGGFKSDMTGTKALALEDFARRHGHAFVRFDYLGHGESSGEFEEGTIGRWAEDAIAVIDELTEGSQILVGSSMGGWIMLLTALARPERVAGLIGIAAAPDFTEDLMYARFDEAARQALEREGVYYEPSDYDEPYPITKRLIDEARSHLLLRGRIPITAPARLLHGMRDEAVPWEWSAKLAGQLESEDVEITLVKAGDHRLSEPADIARLERTLVELIAAVGG